MGKSYFKNMHRQQVQIYFISSSLINIPVLNQSTSAIIDSINIYNQLGIHLQDWCRWCDIYIYIYIYIYMYNIYIYIYIYIYVYMKMWYALTKKYIYFYITLTNCINYSVCNCWDWSIHVMNLAVKIKQFCRQLPKLSK